MSFALKLILLAIGCMIAGLLMIAFFGALWARWGFGCAFLFFAVVLLLIGWRMDRQDRKIREGLENS